MEFTNILSTHAGVNSTRKISNTKQNVSPRIFSGLRRTGGLDPPTSIFQV
jgi:hypothetical protein